MCVEMELDEQILSGLVRGNVSPTGSSQTARQDKDYDHEAIPYKTYSTEQSGAARTSLLSTHGTRVTRSSQIDSNGIKRG